MSTNVFDDHRRVFCARPAGGPKHLRAFVASS